MGRKIRKRTFERRNTFYDNENELYFNREVDEFPESTSVITSPVAPKSLECEYNEESELESDSESSSPPSNAVTKEEEEHSEDNDSTMDDEACEEWMTSFYVYNRSSSNLIRDLCTIQQNPKLRAVTEKGVKRTLKRFQNDIQTTEYNFCRNSKCSALLSKDRFCLRQGCFRKSLCQRNSSSSKKVVIFDLRTQLQEIAEMNNLKCEAILKQRKGRCKLNGRICETPKFKQIATDVDKNNESGRVHLLASIATDGFRKRGHCRAEIWPIFICLHDLSGDKHVEYRPENTILAGLIKAPHSLKSNDFQHVFRKVDRELQLLERHPVHVSDTKLSIKLFNCSVDLDASRKLFGLPKWRSYYGCSRCNTKGTPVAGANSRMSRICWKPNDTSKNYDNNFQPNVSPVSLPPPWEHGYDYLHLFSLGINKARLSELFETNLTTSRTVMTATERSRLEEVLTSARFVKGKNPPFAGSLVWKNITGAEVDDVFHIMIPLLVCMFPGRRDDYARLLTFQWLMSRKLKDQDLSSQDVQRIGLLALDMSKVIGDNFPQIYSMKMHHVLDHMVPNLSTNGSPETSSTSPFERFNQILGRSMKSYSTAPLIEMGKRFIELTRIRRVMLKWKFIVDQSAVDQPAKTPEPSGNN